MDDDDDDGGGDDREQSGKLRVRRLHRRPQRRSLNRAVGFLSSAAKNGAAKCRRIVLSRCQASLLSRARFAYATPLFASSLVGGGSSEEFEIITIMVSEDITTGSNHVFVPLPPSARPPPPPKYLEWSGKEDHRKRALQREISDKHDTTASPPSVRCATIRR